MEQQFLLLIKWKQTIYRRVVHTTGFDVAHYKWCIKGFIVTQKQLTNHSNIIIYIFKNNHLPYKMTQINNKWEICENCEIIEVLKLDNFNLNDKISKLKKEISKLKKEISELKNMIMFQPGSNEYKKAEKEFDDLKN